MTKPDNDFADGELAGLSARPGPANSICDVAGIRVGQTHDEVIRTGVTVILPDAACVCAVDVRGGGPGTRETDALAAENLVEAVHGIVLAGGSVYGLAAADAVCAWLGAQGRGFRFDQFGPGIPAAPVVPAAILFDLANGGGQGLGRGAALCQAWTEGGARARGETVSLGRTGAGFRGLVRALAGGVRTASIVTEEAFHSRRPGRGV